MVRIWDDITNMPPLAVTIAWLATNIVYVLLAWGPPAAFSGAFGTLSVGPPSLGYWLIPLLWVWYYALYKAALARIPLATRRPSLVFVVALILYVVCTATAAVLYNRRENPPTWLLTSVSILTISAVLAAMASIWTAAATLVHFERQAPKGERLDPPNLFPPRAHRYLPVASHRFYSTLGTFMWALYLPIGVWILKRRIETMLLAAPDGSEMAS